MGDFCHEDHYRNSFVLLVCSDHFCSHVTCGVHVGGGTITTFGTTAGESSARPSLEGWPSRSHHSIPGDLSRLGGKGFAEVGSRAIVMGKPAEEIVLALGNELSLGYFPRDLLVLDKCLRPLGLVRREDVLGIFAFKWVFDFPYHVALLVDFFRRFLDILLDFTEDGF